jgi:hypothetical protein
MPTISGYAGSCASDASYGSVAWTSAGNAIGANNGTTAEALGTGPGTTQYLSVSNFAWSALLPPGAVVTSITFRVWKVNTALSFGTDLKDSRVRVLQGGVPGGVDYSLGTLWPVGAITAVDHVVGLGGWTWTPADINSSGFGLVIAGVDSVFLDARIDAVWAEVTYTLGDLDVDPLEEHSPFLPFSY